MPSRVVPIMRLQGVVSSGAGRCSRRNSQVRGPVAQDRVRLGCGGAPGHADDQEPRAEPVAAGGQSQGPLRLEREAFGLDHNELSSEMLAEDLRARGQFLDAIDDEFIRDLRRAMPLHDIGKVGIPDGILLKPGLLTDSEIVQMRRHAEIGGRTIRSVRERTPSADFLLVAEQIAWGHHERWDGTGYPAGLATQSIPLSARLAAVADVYDALTTDRVYRVAVPHEEAARVIRDGAGTQFDPTIVEAFFACESQLAGIAIEP